MDKLPELKTVELPEFKGVKTVDTEHARLLDVFGIPRKKAKPNRRTVAASIRGSVPDGKLKSAAIKLTSHKYGEQAIAGYTQYGPDRRTVTVLSAPDSDDAGGITVRGHEGRHATRHIYRRPKPMTPNEAAAMQIVEDVNIETTPLPHVRSDRTLEMYRRAHLAIALKDLRNVINTARAVKAGKAPDTAETRNARLLAATRLKAMLEHYGKGHSGGYYDKTGRQARKALLKIKSLVGPETSKALATVIKLAQSPRTRNRAISVLSILLERPEPEYEDEEEKPEPELLDKDSDSLAGYGSLGTAMEGHMDVIELRPRTIATAKERKVSVIHAPDGVHLNPTRYVSAIANHDANGLFQRRIRRKPGGTVLIDASGSMGVSNRNLTELLKLIPMATVAYYSGRDRRARGQLSIYAKEGKRFAGKLPDESLQGGNAVDLAAVRWLLKQPKPWHLVSDLGFLGGIAGSEIIAHALVSRARARGELTVHHSLDAAYEAFGGKGELP